MNGIMSVKSSFSHWRQSIYSDNWCTSRRGRQPRASQCPPFTTLTRDWLKREMEILVCVHTEEKNICRHRFCLVKLIYIFEFQIQIWNSASCFAPKFKFRNSTWNSKVIPNLTLNDAYPQDHSDLLFLIRLLP